MAGFRTPAPERAEGIAANGRPRESVWDYPRPPRVEAVDRAVRVELGGAPVAASARALRVCETAGPPVVYLPRADVSPAALQASPGSTFCEWKGSATYFDVHAGGRRAERAAWTYEDPSPAFAELCGHIAFYPGRVECYLDDERVLPQPGQFYGGWITAEITGPFKGEPGSEGW
jgi:uncharacterized protein (DUF427 family)